MTLHLLKVATHKIAVRFYKSSFLKQKLTNLFLVTVVAQFTAKTSNLEKAIYVWSLIFCSINIVKSHILLTSKNFMFYGFMWKTFFYSRKWLGGWRLPCPVPLMPFFTALYCLRGF